MSLKCSAARFCFALTLFFFHSSSCLDFVVSIAKQDCCRWSFLIFAVGCFFHLSKISCSGMKESSDSGTKTSS